MVQFIGFSLFMAWKKEKAWILRLMFPLLLNERLQVLISCVARWLVVHMY